MANVLLQALPQQEAVDYLKSKGFDLPPTFDWRDMWEKSHATAFTVAKSTGFDILGDIHAAVLDAKQNGTPFREFQKQLTPILQAKGWWGQKEMADPLTGEVETVQLGSPRRLAIIYDTNMRMAYAAGRWAQIERTRDSAPYLQYVCILDGRTRPQHRAWHGITLPIDNPFWSTHFPPNGWRCRCSVRQLSEADLAELGYQVSSDQPDDSRLWTNDRTGETMLVPNGVDPGFGYNPGKAAIEENAAKVFGDKLAGLPPRIAAEASAAAGQVVLNAQGAEFGSWVEDLAGQLDEGRPRATLERRVVGVFDNAVLDFLDRRGSLPESGAITVSDRNILHMLRDAKAAKGTALSAEDVARLPAILAGPEAVLWDRQSNQGFLYVFSPQDPRKGKIVVRIDSQEKLPGSKGTIVTNTVVTAGLVDVARLQDGNAYGLVAGKI